MKGIILAGGHGTRLEPMTRAVSKQLLPVYDKPMIYYPLSVLIECGITEIAVIIKSAHYDQFHKLLEYGAQWGVEIEYYFQNHPKGIADAFLVAEKFIRNEPVCLILGDNIFTSAEPIVTVCKKFQDGDGTVGYDGAFIIGYETTSPERYGVMFFSVHGELMGIQEKPKAPLSSYAVTGVYFYDNTVVARAKKLKPSARGELEITDINNAYIEEGKMECCLLKTTLDYWLDAGTPEDLHWASSLIRTRQKESGIRIGCPDAAAKKVRSQ